MLILLLVLKAKCHYPKSFLTFICKSSKYCTFPCQRPCSCHMIWRQYQYHSLQDDLSFRNIKWSYVVLEWCILFQYIYISKRCIYLLCMIHSQEMVLVHRQHRIYSIWRQSATVHNIINLPSKYDYKLFLYAGRISLSTSTMCYWCWQDDRRL